MVSANPTGPDHRRLGAERRLRRLGRAAARVRGPRGRARVLLQRRRRADGALPRLGRGGPARGGAARGRLPAASTSPSSPRVEGDPVAARCSSRSRRRSSASASTSTRGRSRASSSSGCPSSCRGSTRTRRTARSGRARRRTATTRTASLVRSAEQGGAPTYRAADVVYLVDKLERGFDRAIYVLGADHHGTRNWYAAVARMLGYDPERVEVLLYQLVHLTRGGEQAKMSKRRGDVVFLDELHGRDRRRRRALVPRQPRARPDDRDRRRPRRRADARRTRSTTSSTRTRGSPGSCATRATPRSSAEPPAELAPEERELIKRLAEFPGVAAEAAERRGPQAIPTYAIRVADDFHRFYHDHRVLESDAQAFRLGALPRDADRDRALPRPRRGRGARADVGSARWRGRSVGCQGRPGNVPDRNLALELVRVTEAAAMARGPLGRARRQGSPPTRRRSTRCALMLDTVAMDGVVVIGEGEKDEAPMLYNGEEVGDGTGPAVDVAVDPLEGTRLTALGPAERDRRDRRRRARDDVLPGRGRLHGQDRRRAGGGRRDRHRRAAGARTSSASRRRKGMHAERGHGRRARARPPRGADRRAARGRARRCS